MLHDAFFVALLCGLCSLDSTSFLQAMFSRPLVLGTLTGLVLGAPGAGLASGCLIELLWLGNLPVGSVVPPDFSLASSLAAGMAILIHRHNPALSQEACASWTLFFSIPVALAGGLADHWQRRSSARLASWAETRLEAGDEQALLKAVGISLSVSFARSFVLAFLGIYYLAPALGALLSSLLAPELRALEWMYWLSLMLGFAVLTDQFWERRWLRVAALSFGVTVLAAYVWELNSAVVLLGALTAGTVLAVINEALIRRRAARAQAEEGR
jgi:mannose/fructose/N-acetylgalactosamine-specific phosphotransferase system component IIC